MRNLKRVLSLALAAVMLMGMMIVGTSAADVSDFTDADKITNLEAASVTTAIGVFSGYGDGSFGAEKYVNRAEMATIICKILRGANVNANIFKGIGKFQDLAGYEWAEGYINMCASQGIVNGTSATTFEPGRPVKTWEAALMLQRALGWWAANDPANSTISEITVTSKANGLGLYGDLILSADAYLTRNDVAEMVFNAIAKNVPVVYNESFGLYRNATSTNFFSGVSFDYRESLAYQTFGLVYASGEQDVYGRPAITWGYGTLTSSNIDDYGNITNYAVAGNRNFKTTLVTVPDEPVLEYTTSVSNSTIYNALNLSGNTTKFDLYVDGKKDASGTTAIAKNSNGLKDSGGNNVTGNGVLTQIFTNPKADMSGQNPYIAVVINTYIMKVDTVVSATRNSDAKVTVANRDYAPSNYPYAAASFDANYETEAFAKDDVVLINVAYSALADGGDNKYHIQTMQVVEPVIGEMTRYTETRNTMVVDGVTYSFDANANQDANLYKANGGAVGDNVAIYMDNYGYAIDVQNAGNELVTSYALVLAVDKDNASVFNNNSAWVKLLLMDNTVVEAKFAFGNDGGSRWTYDQLKLLGTKQTKDTLYTNIQQIVTYSVNDDGVYSLYSANTSNGSTLKTDPNRSIATVTGVGNKFMNNGTVLIMPVNKGRDQYAIYTGVRNIPTINETGYTQEAIDTTNSSLVNVIYSETSIASTSTDLIYIASKGEYVNDKNLGPYVNYTAVINGEIVDLKVLGKLIGGGVVITDPATGIVENALYSAITTNNKDIVTASVFAAEDLDKEGPNPGDYYNGTGIVKAYKDIIGVGATEAAATYYTWSDDVLVARIEKDTSSGRIIVSNPSITSLPTINNAIVYYGVAPGNAGQITWIYVVDATIGLAASDVTANTTVSGPQSFGNVNSGKTLTINAAATDVVTIEGDVEGDVVVNTGKVVIKGVVKGSVTAAAGTNVTIGTVADGAEVDVDSKTTGTIALVKKGADVTVNVSQNGADAPTGPAISASEEAIKVTSGADATVKAGSIHASYKGVWTTEEHPTGNADPIWEDDLSTYAFNFVDDGPATVRIEFKKGDTMVYWQEWVTTAGMNETMILPLEAIGLNSYKDGATVTYGYPGGAGGLNTKYKFGTGFGFATADDAGGNGVCCFENGEYYTYTITNITHEELLFSGGFTYADNAHRS